MHLKVPNIPVTIKKGNYIRVDTTIYNMTRIM